ncbi:hypothetical protein E2C01_024664 [Portunus trituberculatus]|uniref:Uncharacterized protein n=1 Tax=Portunus trituberculatus TaxID=210409 RepID=A0A5B7EDS7_PORTR|nr:hypothetical protein [Portunus trituberculatus]
MRVPAVVHDQVFPLSRPLKCTLIRGQLRGRVSSRTVQREEECREMGGIGESGRGAMRPRFQEHPTKKTSVHPCQFLPSVALIEPRTFREGREKRRGAPEMMVVRRKEGDACVRERPARTPFSNGCSAGVVVVAAGVVLVAWHGGSVQK